MCASSAISDYYMRPNWPGQLNPPLYYYQGGLGGFQQIVQSDPETKEMLRKVMQLLDSIDKRLGDRECMDEKKAEFYRALDLDPPSEASNA